MPALIYKLTPLLSTNISNFVKFANNLDVDIFWTTQKVYFANMITLFFSDRHKKSMIIGDLRIIKSNLLKDINRQNLDLKFGKC